MASSKSHKKNVKLVRPTLPNPFVSTPNDKEHGQVKQIMEVLVQKLSNMYPPKVTNQEIVAKFKEEGGEDGIKITKLSKAERKEKFHAKRNEMRLANAEGQQNLKYRKDVTIGLKKCLKGLSSPGEFCALIFDSSVNFEPLRCLFEKGQKPPNGPIILGIPKLGELVRKPLGFPAVCMAFAKDIMDKTPTHHFYPIVELLLGNMKEKKSLLEPTLPCDIAATSKEDVVKLAPRDDKTLSYVNTEDNSSVLRTNSNKQCDETDYSLAPDSVFPKIKLLYREDDSCRVFIPELLSKKKRKGVDNEGGGGAVSSESIVGDSDFISFSSAPPPSKTIKLA